MSDNIILVDWFSFTLHNNMTIEQVKDFLGLGTACSWLERSGHYGYKQAHYCGGICIMWDGFGDDMGVCVEMSGQGCRQFETSSCKSFASCSRKSARTRSSSTSPDLTLLMMI